MRDRTDCLNGSGVSGKRNEDGGVPHLTIYVFRLTSRKREHSGGLSLGRR